jgi:hypothetical protein
MLSEWRDLHHLTPEAVTLQNGSAGKCAVWGPKRHQDADHTFLEVIEGHDASPCGFSQPAACFHVAIGLKPIMNDRETVLRLGRI